MHIIRGFVTAACLALGGAGGGVIALNPHLSSPRLLAAGIIAALLGIIGGGVGLAGLFARAERR